MIEFDEKIVGVWFVAIVENKQDWLAAIRELEEDRKYELTYRFRYYVDDKLMDSEDKKNWYKGIITGTRNYVVMTFRTVFKKMESGATGPSYELMNEGDYDEFLRRFQDMPFVAARMMGKEEEEADGYVNG